MAWYLENEDVIPMLTNGSYGLVMSEQDLVALRAAATLGDLEKALFEIAGNQRDPKKGRDALRTAFADNGGPPQEQLREIRAVLSPSSLINAAALSTGALIKLHTAIRDALQDDDDAPKGREPYRVRATSDWAICRDLLEAELKWRGANFDPITW